MNIAVDTFASRINNVVNIHRAAEDISNAEIIGVLEMIKLEIFNDAMKDEDDTEP